MSSLFVRDEENRYRYHQGDIYRDFECLEYFELNGDDMVFSLIKYNYVIIMSQDCDLNQDYNLRKEIKEKSDNRNVYYGNELSNILVVPLFNFEHFIGGSHLSNLGKNINTTYLKSDSAKKALTNNNNPRYHYIDFSGNELMIPSIMDFKQYFTVSTEYAYARFKGDYVCSVCELFREQISQRFANYLSRIALPV